MAKSRAQEYLDQADKALKRAAKAKPDDENEDRYTLIQIASGYATLASIAVGENV